MTCKEYLSTMLMPFGVEEKTIDLILLDQNLDAGKEVAGKQDTKIIKSAVYREFSTLIPLANISEGGYSVSWNTEAFKLWYSALANELGEEDTLNISKICSPKGLW